jgi:hypothetical protein
LFWAISPLRTINSFAIFINFHYPINLL